MERLTAMNKEKTAHFYPQCFERCGGVGSSEKCDNCDLSNRACDKLGEYEDLEEQGLLLRLPCKEGDIVYRICPKCNDKHNGSCENCAWRYSEFNKGCTVYGLWSDGQFPASKCHVVPYKVSWNYYPNLLEHFGKTVFLTQAEAEQAIESMLKEVQVE